VRINTDELDPDTNIGPQASARIVLHSGLHHVYSAAGALCGRLSTERLRALWDRFHQARSTLPEGAQRGSFESEVCSLLRRLVPGTPAKKQKAWERNHWATPGPIMAALRALTGFDTECFGSPLNVHKDTACYYTEFAADGVFGASHDAFKSAWSGSMELNPEYTPEALLRAVRQAVSCAKAATAPFLAVAVLPAWDDSPFSRVLARHLSVATRWCGCQ